MFIAASNSLNNDVTDTSCIIGQIVTGVGFLGAGVMLAKDGIVVGVTSAATIWVLAAIGVAIDIAGELSAIKVSVLVVGILLVLMYWKTISPHLLRVYIQNFMTGKNVTSNLSPFTFYNILVLSLCHVIKGKMG